jgi:CubicO group peptidase (beta-lactamase class C family)
MRVGVLKTDEFVRARRVVQQAVLRAAFPAAVVEVGDAVKPVWREAFGTLTYDSDSPPAREDTLFDLASLTKVIVTTTLAMQFAEAGRLDLDEPIRQRLPEWRGRDRDDVRVRALLAHCAGLTAWLPFYRDHAGKREFQHAICELPLEYRPGTQALYSDLGFILLAFILEGVAGIPLDRQAASLAERVTSSPLLFNPPVSHRANAAPTERDSWRGRLLVGEVHDENAWALGGTAGHSGLFGTAQAVGDFARAMLQSLAGTAPPAQRLASRETLWLFLASTGVPGSSRLLGWDGMRPTSSCGTMMSASAFGHTGFTGTSLWIDPAAGLYIVLLTNRVHPSRDNTAIRQVRPACHDAVMEVVHARGRRA